MNKLSKVLISEFLIKFMGVHFLEPECIYAFCISGALANGLLIKDKIKC